MRPFEGLDEGDPLRALEWHALLARLAAERDLRQELAGAAGRGDGASFAAAAEAMFDHPPQGAPCVNPDALADGKSNGGITAAAGAQAPEADHGARGLQ